jgi:DNA polymerase-1
MIAVVDELMALAEGPVNEEGYSLVLAVDSETTGLNLMKDNIIVSSFYVPHPLTLPDLAIEDEYVAWVAPGPVLDCQVYQDIFAPLLYHPKVLKVGHNLSGYDWFLFRNAGIFIEGPIHDSVVMSWLHNENKVSHELKRLVGLFFNRHMDPFSKHSSLDIRDWDFDTMLNYAGLDAFAHYDVWAELRRRLMRFEMNNGMTAWEFYCEFLEPFQQVLRNMMSRGICIDLKFLQSLAMEVLEEKEELQRWFNNEWISMQAERGTFYMTEAEERTDDDRRMRGLAPKVVGVRPINLNSTPQLRYLFFELLGRKVLKKTKPGKTGEQAPSLAAEVLEEYIDNEGCVYAETLLAFRQLHKIYGTYIGDDPDDEVPIGRHKTNGGLRRKVVGGRVYTTLKLGPVTGRLASANPNLQNIPARTELGKKIRFAFRAERGYKLIVADYSQLEMRLFAHFSGEPDMIDAIQSGKDLHCATAALMFNVPYDDIHIAKLKADEEVDVLINEYGITDLELSELDKTSLAHRQGAKTIGFGLLYGQGPKRLAGQLGISVKEAKALIRRFFDAYPNAQNWIHTVWAECEANGVVWTYLGRPRRIEEIRSSVDWIRARSQRQAVNSIIQGSAADIVMNAMLEADTDMDLKFDGCRLLLQVHDELIFEVPEANAQRAMKRVIEIMQVPQDDDMAVPLPVSAHIGDSWGEAK